MGVHDQIVFMDGTLLCPDGHSMIGIHLSTRAFGGRGLIYRVIHDTIVLEGLRTLSRGLGGYSADIFAFGYCKSCYNCHGYGYDYSRIEFKFVIRHGHILSVSAIESIDSYQPNYSLFDDEYRSPYDLYSTHASIIEAVEAWEKGLL